MSYKITNTFELLKQKPVDINILSYSLTAARVIIDRSDECVVRTVFIHQFDDTIKTIIKRVTDSDAELNTFVFNDMVTTAREVTVAQFDNNVVITIAGDTYTMFITLV